MLAVNEGCQSGYRPSLPDSFEAGDLMAGQDPHRFETGLARHVWQTRYRGPDETCIEDTWRRVADAVAEAEADRREQHARAFYRLLEDFRFLPGGRILAHAGRPGPHTLFNCFVMGELVDDPEALNEALHEAALTLQHGGGIGYDFSTLLPAAAVTTANPAPGPVRVIELFDRVCRQDFPARGRPGAMMATLRCDHPDVLSFIDAKQQAGSLVACNLSLLISDAFMQAVREGADWRLHHAQAPSISTFLPARELWNRIIASAYASGEPGVLFVDRINATDNLGYRDTISTSNPCGEVPMPHYGACNLGSINLTRFVRNPFSNAARWDLDGLVATASTATRFLDDVIEVSPYPLPQQSSQERATRRIGLGVTGLADSLVMLGLRYDSQHARNAATTALRTLCHAAYRTSCQLAAEKGSYPNFDRDQLLQRPFITELPQALRGRIADQGMRNSHLMAIAPAGSISLLADTVSSGIEPLQASRTRYRVHGQDTGEQEFLVDAYAARRWRELHADRPLPDTFVTAGQLSVQAHLQMQRAVQRHVDNAISKTVNLAPDADRETVRNVFELAYDMGLKGCTVYRPNPITGDAVVGGRCTANGSAGHLPGFCE